MRTEHSRIWLIAILCGVCLTWPLPLGGALLAVAASFGFVISREAELGPGSAKRPGGAGNTDRASTTEVKAP
jgi:hypothetical protein